MSGDIHEIAKLTAKETVQQTFLALGVDISTPEAVVSTQKDFAFMRNARYTIRRGAMIIFTGLLVSGLAALGIHFRD